MNRLWIQKSYSTFYQAHLKQNTNGWLHQKFQKCSEITECALSKITEMTDFTPHMKGSL